MKTFLRNADHHGVAAYLAAFIKQRVLMVEALAWIPMLVF